MSTKVIFDETSFSSFQKELHVPPESNNAGDNPSVISDVVKERVPTLWYGNDYVELVPRDVETTKDITSCSYIIKDTKKYLCKSTIIINLPQFKIDQTKYPDLYIEWKKDLEYLIFQQAIMEMNGTFLGRHDVNTIKVFSNWLDHKYNEVDDFYNRKLHTGDCFQDCDMLLKQPWFFTDDSPHSLCIDKNDQVTFKYQWNLDIKSLVTCTRNFVNVPYDPDYTINKPKIPCPNLIVELLNPHTMNDCHVIPKEIIHDDFITLHGKTNGSTDDIIKVKLSSVEPVKSIFYIIEEVDNSYPLEKFKLSYDNSLNKRISPIKTVSWELQKEKYRFKDIPTSYFENISTDHYPGHPRYVGMGAINLCYDPTSIDIQPGVVLIGDNAGKLIFKLRDNMTNDYEFKITVVLMITRKDVIKRS